MSDVNEAQLAQLRGAQALLDKLLRDPKTRREAEKLVKVHRPDFTTTEDVAAPYVEKIDKLEKKLDEYLEGERNGKQDREADAQFKRLRDSGYSDEAETEIKKLMRERTIPDVEAAAALYDKLHPPLPAPTPSGFEGASWGIGDANNDDDKLLFENEDKWAEQEARKAWKESA